MNRSLSPRSVLAAIALSLPAALLAAACGGGVTVPPGGGGSGGSAGGTTGTGTTTTTTTGSGGSAGCAGGKLDCGAGCVDPKTDAANCGACGAACLPGQSCVSGACQCAPGQTECTAGCSDLQKDPDNCGACDQPCVNGYYCSLGACALQCDPGLVACGSACTDTGTDADHCGGCDQPCPVPANSAPTCVGGTCGSTCLPGFVDCNLDPTDGCEVDTQNDAANCGACLAVCAPAGAQGACVAGACTIGSCSTNLVDCNSDVSDGCETDVVNDAASCGGCGFTCEATNVAAPACAAGLCAPTCAAPFGDCNGPQPGDVDDGCETDLSSDVAHCGACGNACAAGQKCCAGGCQDTTSCALTVTGVAGVSGWQNGGDWVTITGTGFGPGVKVLFGDGVAPAWAKDGQTLKVQTPPHPNGVVDITVVQGSDTVVAHGAFIYKAGGLMTTWQHKAMVKVRGEIPGLTVLQNGLVLVVGGTTVPDQAANSLNTGELYNRQTDVVTAVGNSMSVPRWRNSAVTLLTGKALITGGCSGCAGGNSKSADLYDPTTNTFSAAAPLTNAHDNVHAVLMPDGKVFLSSASTPVIELYDPIANTWTAVPHTQAHLYGFAVRLRDGRIMFGAGDGGNKVVEIFDPVTKTFSATGSLNTGRSMLTAHTLPDGRVIVIGGTNVSAGAVNAPQKTFEFWSPTTGTWTPGTTQLALARSWHASALVRDGSILVMGGYPNPGSCAPTANVEQIDPVTGTVSPFAALVTANTEWVATTMLDGSVIGVGGGACGTGSALPDLDFLAGAP